MSGWSGEACTAIPLDDRALTASAQWTRHDNAAYYLRTYTRTTSYTSSLTLAGVRAKWIALVFTRCPTCGFVKVFWNGTSLGQVSLYATTTKRKQIFSTAPFTTVQTGTLEIRVVSSGKVIEIDGVALGAA